MTVGSSVGVRLPGSKKRPIRAPHVSLVWSIKIPDVLICLSNNPIYSPSAFLSSPVSTSMISPSTMNTPSSSSPATPYALNAAAPDSSNSVTTRPLTVQEQSSLAHLDRLKFFLATAPSRWSAPNAPVPIPNPNQHPALNRFLLPSGEYVTCVLWSGLYHITGTDIVRSLVFRFEAFGRPVRNMKKFEEGVFSDLRNLKPGTDACLEEPKSPFLDLLFKYQCIRTQKKQKVFYWFSVPHDRLFLDALERDLKREKIGQEPTTAVQGEPAASFIYDPKRPLFEQFSQAQQHDTQRETKKPDDTPAAAGVVNGIISSADRLVAASNAARQSSVSTAPSRDTSPDSSPSESANGTRLGSAGPGGKQFFSGMLGLSEGSPTYKQRRKKPLKGLTVGVPYGGVRKPSVERKQSPPEEDSDSVTMDGASLAAGQNAFYVRPPQSAPAYGAYSLQHKGSSIPARASQNYSALPMSTASLNQAQLQSHSQTLSRHTLPLTYSRSNLSTSASHLSSVQSSPAPITPRSSFSTSNSLPNSASATTTTFQPSPLAIHSSTLPPYPPHYNSHPSINVPAHPANMNGNYNDEPRESNRAFQCPLFSCGKLFKRMEHLKRHVRTHTLERPFSINARIPVTCMRTRRMDGLLNRLRTARKRSSNRRKTRG
ncbi:STE-domain-containing protein [Sistotremastrum suecicum HHB10207 ss-3]|uniref:STE-domain-containing protein n=1 Tax=Sistotremastrum suecicum HHB10207 ss-3 TaxID=1314776 RepID=A0A166C8B6_9AGAM|nr:STE-domain-containing protein [Sistotremastrum suecicum HHB10207 ss-3]